MSLYRARVHAFAFALVLPVASLSLADSAVLNLTGLPLYPHLNRASMDPVVRTDALGRWCRHFSAQTAYPLDVVEAWYRSALAGASETDLTHDDAYKNYAELSGIKLGVGVDYVAVYKVTAQSPTSIELFRCSPVT